MRTITQLSTAFLISLSLIGVSIYFFIEENSDMGKIFIMAAIFAFLTLFIMIRSIYYLKHNATFNEVFFVLIVPLIPVIVVLTQFLLGIYDYGSNLISTSTFDVGTTTYYFYINIVDFILLPYYIFSNFLIFRTFIRYPFIRMKGTSEKGIPPKLFGFLLLLIIPTTYILTSIFLLENLFLMVFAVVYFYSSLLMLFV
ncbi:MAG: hypothetical protein GOP50_06885 [Candidatus Heimdallarchaeota archaeon]|nr:hypothetical protein [Candidatus Heimdallarchaeota archaeon]